MSNMASIFYNRYRSSKTAANAFACPHTGLMMRETRVRGSWRWVGSWIVILLGYDWAEVHNWRSPAIIFNRSISTDGPNVCPIRGTRAKTTKRRSTHWGWPHDSPVSAYRRRVLCNSFTTGTGLPWHCNRMSNQIHTDDGSPAIQLRHKDPLCVTTPWSMWKWWDKPSRAVTQSTRRIIASGW